MHRASAQNSPVKLQHFTSIFPGATILASVIRPAAICGVQRDVRAVFIKKFDTHGSNRSASRPSPRSKKNSMHSETSPRSPAWPLFLFPISKEDVRRKAFAGTRARANVINLVDIATISRRDTPPFAEYPPRGFYTRYASGNAIRIYFIVPEIEAAQTSPVCPS